MRDHKRQEGLATRAIHGSPTTAAAGSPVVSPVFQSATFANPVGSSDGLLYTRYGNNPNQLALAARLAALDGGESAILLGSGMAATALAHLAVLHPGDHLLASEWLYGGTRQLFDDEFGRLGIEVSYVNPSDLRNWRSNLRKNTRAVFVEAITNPLMRVIDIDYLAGFCRDLGLSLLVDSTFASPVNLRPLEVGADVVIHSATKYLNGHSDVIAGAVIGSKPVIDEIQRLMKVWGPAIDPHQAWLVERGLKTLSVRMRQHNANGVAFSKWAATHGAVVSVYYPGLGNHPDHEIASRLLDGFGGMVALDLKTDLEGTKTVLTNLKLVKHAPSLGGVETLVSQPAFTSHAGLSKKQLAVQGIPQGLIRVSLGIEDIEDVIADFEAALSTV
ncbi:MAG: trans-sulfuration enzyme family protein [Gemmatimonadales bacterium]